MSRHQREFSSFHLASVVFLILFVNNTFTSAFQTASPTTCFWNSLTMQRIARCKNLSIFSGSCFSTPTRRKIVSVRQHDIPLLLQQRISIQRAPNPILRPILKFCPESDCEVTDCLQYLASIIVLGILIL